MHNSAWEFVRDSELGDEKTYLYPLLLIKIKLRNYFSTKINCGSWALPYTKIIKATTSLLCWFYVSTIIASVKSGTFVGCNPAIS